MITIEELAQVKQRFPPGTIMHVAQGVMGYGIKDTIIDLSGYSITVGRIYSFCGRKPLQ